ncbi:hypothetical protein BX600DRAFT_433800 [Xylariales sp. PMI_506]|nr:hypothetical protein BX600DRAFT_433800 [Xylariales sp. PMI_506]
MTNPVYDITPLSYNSQCITFTEWVSLLTLCFAPLLAHIASGTPRVSYLTRRRPKWYDSVCHYNPTSILWRYFVIADRRIRALQWSNIDMAASNAIFWTDYGWDGAEYMVDMSMPFCIELPEHSRAEIMSITMLKTIITTAQGISAIYGLVYNASDGLNYLQQMGVDTIFFPLAIMGLLRCSAAAWLTDQYGYILRDDIQMDPLYSTPNTVVTIYQGTQEPSDQSKHMDTTNIYVQSSLRYEPTSYWASRVFRLFYFCILSGLWAICFIYTVPGVIFQARGFTTTVYFTLLLFWFLFTITLVVFTFYSVRGSTTSTIIPCITTVWYRLYTLIVILAALVLIVIASIETNQIATGAYSSVASNLPTKCSKSAIYTFYLSTKYNFLGFLSNENAFSYTDQAGRNTSWGSLTLDNHASGGEFWGYNFTGYCVGIPQNTTLVEDLAI